MWIMQSSVKGIGVWYVVFPEAIPISEDLHDRGLVRSALTYGQTPAGEAGHRDQLNAFVHGISGGLCHPNNVRTAIGEARNRVGLPRPADEPAHLP
ncbi:hypothetical protein OG874_02720 [Nocardia sp. NBC_00565]|uniref:hypothetical protein n=1 Tax=Nocardia sp. NBC_00565 TaxID=2975993 RepID=UPI002E817400|nr:hypothetical protein [Nocardia sp. NBC_00565]WUC04147.1 hypothetical protein OG874_02720 [Nocardia sp. NBC_00565]